MKERYFITGATGFVGANVVRALVSHGQHVSVLVRNKKRIARIADVAGKISIIEGDVKTSNFARIFAKEKPAVILNFSSYGTLPSQTNVDEMMDVNVKGLVRMLSAANNSSVRLFVQTGSSSEYGSKRVKMKETDLPAPVNDYGVSKAAASLYCQKTAGSSSFSVVVLRLFSPYGYFDEPSRFIPSVIRSALSGQPMDASDSTYVRDFIFIDDVVRAYERVVSGKLKMVNGQIFNIGSGKQHTLNDIVRTMSTLGAPVNVRWNAKSKQLRQEEPVRWEADIAKAGALLKWRPKESLKRGLEKTILWTKRNTFI